MFYIPTKTLNQTLPKLRYVQDNTDAYTNISCDKILRAQVNVHIHRALGQREELSRVIGSTVVAALYNLLGKK